MSSISHRPECHVVVTIISLCKVFCKLLRPGFATKSLIAVVVSVSAEVVGKRNTIVLIISRHEDVSFRSINGHPDIQPSHFVRRLRFCISSLSVNLLYRLQLTSLLYHPLTMFSSFLGGSKESNAASSSSAEQGSSSTSGELHPPHERLSSPESTFGPLSKQDTEWHCAGAFAAETQTFYALTGGKDAKLIMCQVIHSGVG